MISTKSWREFRIRRIWFQKELCVRDVFGISRSLRRGVTAHSKNMRIDKELRNAINRWGREANTKLGVARLDMGDTYTTLDSIMPLILEFSRALWVIHLTNRDELFCQGGTKGDLYKWTRDSFQTRVTTLLWCLKDSDFRPKYGTSFSTMCLGCVMFRWDDFWS